MQEFDKLCQYNISLLITTFINSLNDVMTSCLFNDDVKFLWLCNQFLIFLAVNVFDKAAVTLLVDQDRQKKSTMDYYCSGMHKNTSENFTVYEDAPVFHNSTFFLDV